MNESRTVTWLRRNVPNEKVVNVRLGWQQEQEDIALAQALETNEYINEIHFNVPQDQQHRWDNLLPIGAVPAIRLSLVPRARSLALARALPKSRSQKHTTEKL